MAQHYLSVCFWNVNSKEEAIKPLAEIVGENEIDVVILAECPISSDELAAELSLHVGQSFVADVINSAGRLTWAYRHGVRVRPAFDGDKISIKEVYPPRGPSILLCGIHASSRLSREVAELNVLIPRAAASVREEEVRAGHERTIVCGDFNLSPFDEGITSSESFHGVMSRRTALELERVVYDRKSKYFYNPMWKILAEDEDVCGTYYHRSNSPFEHFWYCMDQVLFRPDLIQYLALKPVEIIKATANYRLISEVGRPSLSDHLPLVARMLNN